MATDYFLELKDDKDALLYYNLAAHTPGIPDYALRFSLNFGIKSNERQKTEELWATIRDSSNDPDTKERAQAYIDRLEIFDYLGCGVEDISGKIRKNSDVARRFGHGGYYPRGSRGSVRIHVHHQ